MAPNLSHVATPVEHRRVFEAVHIRAGLSSSQGLKSFHVGVCTTRTSSGTVTTGLSVGAASTEAAADKMTKIEERIVAECLGHRGSEAE